jgi:tetratricopeptide (TPR) repeat protein
MNRHSLIRVVPVVSVFLGLMGSAEARPVGRIRNIRPVVEVRSHDKSAWNKTKERHSLEPGHYIRSGPTGKADIVFNDGTAITLNSRALIRIEGENTPSKPLALRVMGAFAQIVVRSKGDMEIRAAAGVAAPQGTEYMVSLPDENTMVVTVAEGSVRFFNAQGQVTVGANQQSTAKVGQAPTPPIAVDASGLMQWAFDVAALPVELELPLPTGDLATLEAQANANPNDSAAQMALGHARQRIGDANGALEAFQKAAQLNPTSDTPRVALAVAHLARNNINAARTALQNAPDSALTSTARGLLALRANDLAGAQTALEDATRRDPKLGQAHALLALTLLSQNKTAEAVTVGRRAGQIAPDSAQAQASLALALFYAGQTREAAKTATRAVRLNPESPFALLAQGQALLAQHQTDAARAAFLGAEALAPQLPIVQLNLASAYTRLDMPKRAEKYYRRVLETNPNSAAARTGLGATLLAAGRDKDALPELRRALEIEPNNALARANMAAYHIELGDFSAAKRELQNIAADDPASGYALIKLSEAALFKQKLFEAQEYARKAVKLLPDSAQAHYQLGRVYREMDRTAQAEQQFRQAVVLDPNFAAARFALGLAQEAAESGRDLSRPSSAISSNGSGPRQALNIQNLQTPGAEERIQSAIQDPSVIRSASRSFGDTQIEGKIGEDDTNQAEISHLRDIARERGALGASLSRFHTDGVRDGADLTQERAGFSWGRKKADNPSGFFVLGQIERTKSGGDTGPIPLGPFAPRAQKQIPQLILGYNLQNEEASRTRFLLQADRPTQDITPANGYSSIDARSVHGEIRHDRLLGRHSFTVGGSWGQRRFNGTTFQEAIPPDPFFPGFPAITTTSRTKLNFGQLYMRDNWQVSNKFSLMGELKVERLDYRQNNQMVPPLFPLSDIDDTTTMVLPNVVATYRPNARSGVRFRARRLFTPLRDFELLAPRDVFLFSMGDVPQIDLTGSGRSIEMEYDYTFANGSLFRLGAFHQNLEDASNQATVDRFKTVRFNGLRLRYEGVLNAATTFFVSSDINDAKGTVEVFTPITGYRPTRTPRFTAEVGVQYLSKSGWFAQPSFAFIGSRLQEDLGLGTARERLGSFSLANLRVGKRSGLRSVIFVEVANVFDKKYLAPQGGFLGNLQPGRQIRVGIALRQ